MSVEYNEKIKRQRKLIKLLDQIRALQARRENDEDLLPEQLEKIDRYAEVIEELDDLDEELGEMQEEMKENGSVTSSKSTRSQRESLKGTDDKNEESDGGESANEEVKEAPLVWHVDVKPSGSPWAEKYAKLVEEIRELSLQEFTKDSTLKMSKKQG